MLAAMTDRNFLHYHSLACSFILFYVTFDWSVFLYWELGGGFSASKFGLQTGKLFKGSWYSVSVHRANQHNCRFKSNDHVFLLHMFRVIRHKSSFIYLCRSIPPPPPTQVGQDIFFVPIALRCIYSVGIPYTRDHLVTQAANYTKHSKHNRQICIPVSRIRTRKPSKQAAANTRLRTHGH